MPFSCMSNPLQKDQASNSAYSICSPFPGRTHLRHSLLPPWKHCTTRLEEQHGLSQAITTSDLPDNYVIKAHVVTSVVEMVRRLVSEDERRANRHGEAFSRTQAIQRALISVNRTTTSMEVRGTRQDIQLRAGYTTYYKYEHLYETFHGDEAQIAASFRRSTFRIPRMSAAQFHFI